MFFVHLAVSVLLRNRFLAALISTSNGKREDFLGKEGRSLLTEMVHLRPHDGAPLGLKSVLKWHYLKSDLKEARTQGYREGGRGQIAPWFQAPRGLIAPNASRSGGPNKVCQQYFSKGNF